jgi:hypothetical protein
MIPSSGQKIPVQLGWYLPPQKVPLAENKFFQTQNGAENIKETVHAMLSVFKNVHVNMNHVRIPLY